MLGFYSHIVLLIQTFVSHFGIEIEHNKAKKNEIKKVTQISFVLTSRPECGKFIGI